MTGCSRGENCGSGVHGELSWTGLSCPRCASATTVEMLAVQRGMATDGKLESDQGIDGLTTPNQKALSVMVGDMLALAILASPEASDRPSSDYLQIHPTDFAPPLKAHRCLQQSRSPSRKPRRPIDHTHGLYQAFGGTQAPARVTLVYIRLVPYPYILYRETLCESTPSK